MPKASLTVTLSRTVPPGTVVVNRLHDDLREYLDCHGYEVVMWDIETMSFTATAFSPEVDSVTLTAVVRARWDGVWGELRRELALDGLLPQCDLDSAPAGFLPIVWGEPGPIVGIDPARSRLSTADGRVVRFDPATG